MAHASRQRRKPMPFAVVRRGRDVVVAGRAELRRWPMHGIIGAVAWRFDGSGITLVHCGASFGTRRKRS